ncbi:MAG: LLM class flavin-dependent oxidoreductase, partial [Chloroflexi bacterium]|nr:LLM class flavin-dependent oxidoreductase [Chloroflexota bacterium]
MQFGLCLPTFEEIATREAILHSAELAEREGFDSLWVTDHVIMAQGQEHPYGHIYEALTTLAVVAGMTERVRLGTSIIVLPQRSAVVVAKEVATLDALSNGRVILGVGAGWNEKEFAFLNANFHRRGKLLEEQVAV